MDAPAAFEGLVGESVAMRALFAEIEVVAASEEPVLILGETGTGKELVARAIHQRSPRRRARLEAVNCALLRRELVRSELFGHAKGAFTGAVDKQVGRLVRAHEGTMFLDEIAELPADAQAMLLRFLEEGEVDPIGGDRVHVDVRLVAATHEALGAWVQAGRFREDLHHRLDVFVLEIPPLRARLEDLPGLVAHFVRRINTDCHLEIAGVTDAALEALAAHPWPGNVRDLEHALRRSMIFRKRGWLGPEDLRFGETGRWRAVASPGVAPGLVSAAEASAPSHPVAPVAAMTLTPPAEAVLAPGAAERVAHLVIGLASAAGVVATSWLVPLAGPARWGDSVEARAPEPTGVAGSPVKAAHALRPNAFVAPGPRDRHAVALELAGVHGWVSSGDLATACGLSGETARRALVALVQRGQLRRVGDGRGARYVVP